MKNRIRKIAIYRSLMLLAVLTTVSNAFANAYSIEAVNKNWVETLNKLALPNTIQLTQNYFEESTEIMNISELAADSISLETSEEPEPQDVVKNELSVWAAGGLSTLSYQPIFGNKENGLGGAFGLGYTRYFSDNWSLSLGAELSSYQSDFSQTKLYDQYDAIDLDPYLTQEMNFRYRVDDYEEKQQLLNLNIPLMLQFQTKKQGNHRFFVSGGVKLGIPVVAKYESKNATIDSKGYYYDWNQTLNEPTSLGYGVFDNQSAKGKLDVGLSYTGSLETGIKWELPGGVNLYTGLYADYGLNDILKGKHRDKFVEYNSFDNNDFTEINSILTSQYTNQSRTQSFTDKVSPLAFGVKLRLGFSLGSVKEKQPCSDIQMDYALPYLETVLQSVEETQKVVEKVQDLTNSMQQQITEIAKRQDEMNRDKPVEDKVIEDDDLPALGVATIHYGFNVSTLTAEQEKILDEYVAVLQNNPSAKIILTGHACNIGNDAVNMRMGQKRADLAKAYLISKGIQAERVLTFTKGETEPLCDNVNEGNRKINRRLEVQII